MAVAIAAVIIAAFSATAANMTVSEAAHGSMIMPGVGAQVLICDTLSGYYLQVASRTPAAASTCAMRGG